MVEYAIIADKLTKKFGDFVADNAISLKVKKGEIFGILGPNGAGKTTLISMLTTLLKPTSGSAKLMGKDVIKDQLAVRKMIGVITEKVTMYPPLTAEENLMFFGRLYGIEKAELKKRITAGLEEFQLTKFRNRQVGTFSLGMKRRLDIVRVLLNDPQVFFLDEPTVGLDPITVAFIKKRIKEINKRGKTIILTTHIMQDADELSDRVALIDHGNLMACDVQSKLKRKLGKHATLEDVFIHYAGEQLRDETQKMEMAPRRGM
ncbi:MAG: ABC transporter related protein [Candidatus Parvarchaeum acidophilus ARMAN-5]|jgi:ABC-2 type transport system ATP-binding protein|uniref:ABC transporter related protein n=1 Tax=Candidatus Parvarchaeum acidophilus ARMAN-5 TaxID=662762 RepID=D6GWD5_PARA5|nr:MAG: ABC transporter related protein [Candidatus Parvarchaeum acidophilus ARMAN-5]